MLGGTDRAELNVTYNYASLFRSALRDYALGSDVLVRLLNGRAARDTVEMLERAVEQLGTDRAEDYWAATRGNAGAALAILLCWARQHPSAVWEVT